MRCVLMRMDRRQSTRGDSMNPMPPMSAARLKTSLAPSATRRQFTWSDRSRQRLSTPGVTLYHSRSGFLSTARMRVKPFSLYQATRFPAIKPPAPATRRRSSLPARGTGPRALGNWYPLMSTRIDASAQVHNTQNAYMLSRFAQAARRPGGGEDTGEGRMRDIALCMELTDFYEHGIARGVVRYAKGRPEWR